MTVSEEQIVSFINTLGNLAVAEANRRIARGEKYVLPSVCIAQSAHETGWGTSRPMQEYNAYFGIKPGSSWTGRVFSADTWEVYDGVPTNVTQLFRAYDSLEDSVADYYDLIINNSRYANALSTYPSDIKSGYNTLYEIWAGGYATDEEYVPNVWNLYQGRSLEQWDAKVDGKTFDPNYTWEGGTGGSSGGDNSSNVEVGDMIYSSDKYNFVKIENLEL